MEGTNGGYNRHYWVHIDKGFPPCCLLLTKKFRGCHIFEMCSLTICLERLHIYVLFKTQKINTARVSFPNYDDLLWQTKDEISPFSKLKHFWMSTECSRKVHWNPDFRQCSVTFQWAFIPTKRFWMAGKFQWPFSNFILVSGKTNPNIFIR